MMCLYVYIEFISNNCTKYERVWFWSVKKPIHMIHFIGYLSAKYLPPFFPINPIPHKIKRLFFYWWKFIPIFLR